MEINFINPLLPTSPLQKKYILHNVHISPIIPVGVNCDTVLYLYN